MNKFDRALLVGLAYQESYKIMEASLNELEELALTCNITTIDKIIQSSNTIDVRYYIGSGKVKEIKNAISILNIDIVIFDDPLSPGQIRNLEKALEVQIIDRSFLILQIFADRAKSKEAMVEVSLAQKLYMLPRLVGMRNSLSRQGGGSFNAKGPGETKLELDRRVISKEISNLKHELKSIRKNRLVNSEKRINNHIPVVALVGYTNAGKSSLMNAFINLYADKKESVLEQDLLFTTLDTKAKRIKKGNHPPFILIDTVGFISKIPPELVASFESTLMDIKNADLILHIINGLDYSSESISLTNRILNGLINENIPRVLVVTKKDLLHEAPMILEDFIYISNKTYEGIDSLYQTINSIIYKDAKIYNIKIPFQSVNNYHKVKNDIHVLNEEYDENGLNVRVLLRPFEVEKFKKDFNNEK